MVSPQDILCELYNVHIADFSYMYFIGIMIEIILSYNSK